MKKKRYSAQEQQTLVLKWQNSGLSKKEFCRQEALTASTFFTWIKKHGILESKNSFSQIVVPTFENYELPRIPELEIEFPSGAKLKVYKPVPADWIKSLF